MAPLIRFDDGQVIEYLDPVYLPEADHILAPTAATENENVCSEVATENIIAAPASQLVIAAQGHQVCHRPVHTQDFILYLPKRLSSPPAIQVKGEIVTEG